MTLVPLKQCRTNPYIASGFDEFDRIFDNFFKNAVTNIAAPTPSLSDIKLHMDISETDKQFIIKAEMPGVEEKDIDLNVEEGLLIISGKKQQETEEEGKTFHRTERSFGSFKRAIALPANTDEDKIKARMKNGVLQIEIEKIRSRRKKQNASI